MNTQTQSKLGLDFFSVLDFCQGEVDCINGEPAKAEQHEEYYRGYGERYALEAMVSGGAENG